MTQERRRALWPRRDLLLGLAILVASFLLVILAASAFGLSTGAVRSDASDVAAGLTTIAFELLFGGGVLLLAWRRGLRLVDLGFVRPRSWSPLAVAFVGAYGVLFAYAVLLALLGSLGFDVSALEEGNALPLNPRQSVATFVVFGTGVLLVAPFCEELFFRALLFRGMRGYWRLTPSLAASGAAFGLFHLNPSALLPFTLIGVLFGWANERSASLWSSIAAHAGLNGVAFLLSAMELGL